MRAPFHEQAVANAPEHSGYNHGVRMANPAAVIVMGDVQSLVQTVFDAGKAPPIKLQPPLGIELFGPGTGDEAKVLILASLGLAQ